MPHGNGQRRTASLHSVCIFVSSYVSCRLSVFEFSVLTRQHTSRAPHQIIGKIRCTVSISGQSYDPMFDHMSSLLHLDVPLNLDTPLGQVSPLRSLHSTNLIQCEINHHVRHSGYRQAG